MNRRNAGWILIAILLLETGGGAWAVSLARFDADTVPALCEPLPKEVTVTVDSVNPAEGKAAIKVTYSGRQRVSIVLYEVQNPNVEDCVLTYAGMIRSEEPTAAAYLEMLCKFGEGEYFSRGLDEPVRGVTPWRESRIPFFLQKGENPPLVRLGVRMEGPGTVWIDDLRLETVSRLQASGALGGLLGGGLGVLGGLWGTLAGLFAARGRGRTGVLGSGLILWLACVALFAYGVSLLVGGHPYAEWYPWLLCGAIGTLVIGPLLPVVRKRYAQAEASRMAAMDAGDTV